MIRIYSQYSYGGYKTFHIEGVENEALGSDSEVTLDATHCFPQSAHAYFQFGGCKMIYRSLPSGELDLVVREIPSNDVDGSGRPLSCAIQFIGDAGDRKTLDNLAVAIANDVAAFGSFFADLFYVRQGLHVEGDKLREYINSWKGNAVPVGDTHPALLSVGRKPGGVFLFVPLSDKFGSDKDVTNRVCKDLNLEYGELGNAVISMKELCSVQKQLKLVVQAEETAGTQTDGGNNVPPTDGDDKQPLTGGNTNLPPADPGQDARIAALEKENQRLKEESKQKAQENFNNLQSLQATAAQKDEENRRLTLQLDRYKKVAYGLAAASVVLAVALIGSCSCSGEKKNKDTDQQKKKEVAWVSNNNYNLLST